MKFDKITLSERRKYEKRFGKIFRVSRKDYQIVYCKNLVLDGKNLAGCCASSQCKIFIDTQYEQIKETLYHELIHAEIAESGLRQTNGWSMDSEEIICEIISSMINLNR